MRIYGNGLGLGLLLVVFFPILKLLLVYRFTSFGLRGMITKWFHSCNDADDSWKFCVLKTAPPAERRAGGAAARDKIQNNLNVRAERVAREWSGEGVEREER